MTNPPDPSRPPAPPASVTVIQQITVTGGYVDQIVGNQNELAPRLDGVTAVPLSEPQTGFVGRRKELKALRADLSGANTSIIAVIFGMGGAGKTQLALQAAHKVKAHYPDYQLEINLKGSHEQSLSDVEALQVVIRALLPDVQLSNEPTSLIAAYRRLLAGKRALIFADDARDATQVRYLIPPAGSALLITSRFRFQFDGRLIDLEALPEIDAVKLLSKRCERLSADDAKQIAVACGCLPLALHIASGILKDTPVTDYLEELNNERGRLDALRDPEDATLDMEASIALSYNRLKPATKSVLCCLGVFQDSFDLQAVAAIFPFGSKKEAREQITILRKRSLIEYNNKAGRYRLHDLIRSFALRHIDGTAEEAARLRYAQHYLSVAEQIDQLDVDGDLPKALNLFRDEFSSIDDAWQWCINRQTSETDELAIEYGAALQVLVDRAYSLEAITARYTSLLPIAERLKRHERIVLAKLAKYASIVGEWDRTERLMQRAIEISQEDATATVALLSAKAVMAVDCGRYIEAAELAERALKLCLKLPNEQDRQFYGPSIQLNLGQALYYTGDLEEARAYFDALVAPETCGNVDPETLATAYMNRGAVWLRQCRLGAAAEDLQRAEELSDNLSEIVRAELHRLLAELALDSDDLDVARRHCTKAQKYLQFVFGSQSPANARIRNEVSVTCARIAVAT